MKSIKFSSSFKKLRKNVSTLLHPFNSFRSNQIEINKLLVSKFEDLYFKFKDLDSLLSGHKASIEFLYARNAIFYKQIRFLQNALIVISSILAGVIFYLFSIS